jgi:hypothetical protein
MRMWLYLRCVWANKVTLLGYLLISIGVWLSTPYSFLLPFDTHSMGLFYVLGAVCQLLTNAGTATYIMCKKVLGGIRKYGIDYGTSSLTINEDYYCEKKGVELALKIWSTKQR